MAFTQRDAVKLFEIHRLQKILEATEAQTKAINNAERAAAERHREDRREREQDRRDREEARWRALCDRWALEHGSPHSPVIFTADETRGAHGLNYYEWTRRERRLAAEREADRQARARAAALERAQRAQEDQLAEEEALRAENEEIYAENVARGYKIMVGMAIVLGLALYAWFF